MPSTLTWLDFSDAERRRTLEYLEAFVQRETRDELGLGAIRDAFAEAMFPGVSTVQRRARYFLFVPWTFQEVERRYGGSPDALQHAKRAELALIDVLADAGETDGVIGLRVRGNLQQLPSMIYWQGLSRWQIRVQLGTREQWSRAVRRGSTEDIVTDDGDLATTSASWWHSNLTPPPGDFPNDASLTLRPEEKDYLRERVTTTCGDSLLSWLANLDTTWEAVDFPWELNSSAMQPEHQRLIRHAQCFSELMLGAALLYNLLLARALEDVEREAIYRDELSYWTTLVESSQHTAWAFDDFWQVLREINSRHSRATRGFVESWLNFVRSGLASEVHTYASAEKLIIDREHQVKTSHARLTNEAALKTWRGAAGAGQLDYRWRSAQRQLFDIVETVSGPS